MISVITVDDLKLHLKKWSGKVALVPTMGALHEGHLALVAEAKKYADNVLVSIFVNPMQFGPGEDFSRYPRQISEDVSLLRELGLCDLVFLPNAAAIYPEGFATHISNSRLARELCGQFRPGHFEGVLTVVNKLIHLCQADVLLMGKKDYQQWVLVKQMVQDLGMVTEIVGVETVREKDGLALSSRNRYLSESDRIAATSIFRTLTAIRESIESGMKSVEDLVEKGSSILEKSIKVQYMTIRRKQDLMEYEDSCLPEHGECVVVFAGHVGKTRLIDNMEVTF
jgi:pantoate--beta-alanine ligase